MYNNAQQPVFTNVAAKLHQNDGRNNDNNNETNDGKQEIRLDFERSEFIGDVSTKKIHSLDLSQEINEVLNTVLFDYHGCTVAARADNSIAITLYFSDNKGTPGEDEFKCLDYSNLVSSRKQSPISRINAWNARNKNKVYSLTNECKQLLSDFMYTNNNGKIEWGKNVREVFENGRTFVAVDGFDIIKFLKKKYGTKAKDKSGRIEYSARVAAKFNERMFIIEIGRVDTTDIMTLAMKTGLLPMQNSLNICTAVPEK